jgi:hypothetical protein
MRCCRPCVHQLAVFDAHGTPITTIAELLANL